ncbi:MAG: type II secretion system minor pseudopilin GspK [Woeseiaceae bacterium]|nr:type II secretion system minor pseudopilin GspK [Woeseiaceae bacterium]
MSIVRRHRGVALITAILVTALAGSVAASLAWDNALDVRRTMVQLHRDQAIQVALGAENWVANILRDDLSDTQTDHLGEVWAQDLPPFPIDGGELYGKIDDLQGRFNVNNLVDQNGEIDTDSLEQFQRLLVAVGLDPRFAGLAADWIDSDRDPSFPDGAEDSIYTGITPGYRSPNQALTSATELAALEGMEKEMFDALAPYIVALPGRTVLNVNTAPGPVLQSLDESMTAADAERLIGEREGEGFVDIVNTFSAFSDVDVNELGENSDYFQLMVVVRIDTVRITYYSVLQRDPNGGVVPILRSLGTT